MFTNNITQLFNVQYPIIQAGMIWCSNWQLAAAVSNAGGLGIIGAGSMYPDILEEQLTKYKQASNKPFAVNLPLLYPDIEQHLSLITKHNVPIVFTSAGNPKTYTARLKQQGITVVHVVASAAFAQKAEAAGVDAVVAEGFEAGGHNGREETTTLCLIPAVVKAVKIPVIAAGGIASGQAMAAMFALGAQGVQMGTRFVASEESSAHIHFKQRVIALREGETQLCLKKLVPVRLIKNEFFEQVAQAEASGANTEVLAQLLGRGRAKKGMFEGDMQQGELEIGQIAATIPTILPAAQIVNQVWSEFLTTIEQLHFSTSSHY
ncbi:MAG: nitronate monooxygenase [Sphingobacteriales bacterium]|nr:nitronate monooxygenase [Sphingobacteriales bacterium]MBP9140097.1 nitronate monooxygenase [Chitinophagales bacterium]MDA0197820.1 nitronate monooxygenase [Bacteroidota bacterium]MBK6889958.1 nitronate monooxygenase [Sphingobacteriales bacterium]MBK7527518.1 nitronate monooxygenase [Sphingobacteriales bacterium]